MHPRHAQIQLIAKGNDTGGHNGMTSRDACGLDKLLHFLRSPAAHYAAAEADHRAAALADHLCNGRDLRGIRILSQ